MPVPLTRRTASSPPLTLGKQLSGADVSAARSMVPASNPSATSAQAKTAALATPPLLDPALAQPSEDVLPPTTSPGPRASQDSPKTARVGAASSESSEAPRIRPSGASASGAPVVHPLNAFRIVQPDGSVREFLARFLTAAQVMADYPGHILSLSGMRPKRLPNNTVLLRWNTYYLHRDTGGRAVTVDTQHERKSLRALHRRNALSSSHIPDFEIHTPLGEGPNTPRTPGAHRRNSSWGSQPAVVFGGTLSTTPSDRGFGADVGNSATHSAAAEAARMVSSTRGARAMHRRNSSWTPRTALTAHGLPSEVLHAGAASAAADVCGDTSLAMGPMPWTIGNPPSPAMVRPPEAATDPSKSPRPGGGAASAGVPLGRHRRRASLDLVLSYAGAKEGQGLLAFTRASKSPTPDRSGALAYQPGPSQAGTPGAYHIRGSPSPAASAMHSGAATVVLWGLADRSPHSKGGHVTNLKMPKGASKAPSHRRRSSWDLELGSGTGPGVGNLAEPDGELRPTAAAGSPGEADKEPGIVVQHVQPQSSRQGNLQGSRAQGAEGAEGGDPSVMPPTEMPMSRRGPLHTPPKSPIRISIPASSSVAAPSEARTGGEYILAKFMNSIGPQGADLLFDGAPEDAQGGSGPPLELVEATLPRGRTVAEAKAPGTLRKEEVELGNWDTFSWALHAGKQESEGAAASAGLRKATEVYDLAVPGPGERRVFSPELVKGVKCGLNSSFGVKNEKALVVEHRKNPVPARYRAGMPERQSKANANDEWNSQVTPVSCIDFRHLEK